MFKFSTYPSILFKYLIKYHLKNLLLIFLIFFALVFFVDLVELYRRAEMKINYGNLEKINFVDLVWMSFLKGPNVMQKILPLTILIGSIITFIRWRQNNYFVITRTIGISMWRLLIPICFSVLILGLISISILNPIASIFNKNFYKLEKSFFGHKKISQFSFNTKGLWIIKKNNKTKFILNASNIDQRKKILKNVKIFMYDENTFFKSKIYADSAIIQEKDLFLSNVIIFSKGEEPRKEDGLSIKTQENFDNIKVLIEKPENLDLFSLFHYIKMMNDSGLNISNHIIYLLKILLQPILMISMVLISASLILRDNERKFPISVISITLIIGFIIYFIADLILALGSMEKINPILAGVGPSMLSLFAGCFLVSSFDEIK